MYIINIIFSNLKTETYTFDDVYDCLDYLDALFTHFSDFHPGENLAFSFCYKAKEDFNRV